MKSPDQFARAVLLLNGVVYLALGLALVYDSLTGGGGWDQTIALLVFGALAVVALWQVLRYGSRPQPGVETSAASPNWRPTP